MKLSGQVAIVTGAARGIGYAIAARLARDGARVIVADIDGPSAERAVQQLLESDGTASAIQSDITVAPERERLVATVLNAFGQIDILVNNAGILPRVDLMNVTSETWRRTMEVNVDAAFFLCQLVLPSMRARQSGRIVNISSMSARTGGQASPPHYATSKTALVGMTRALARTVGGWGITVNAVAPGIIDTEMIADWPPGQREWWLDQIPLARLGMPEDVASAVAFLVGPDSAYITGSTLDVNGGYFMI